MLESLELLDDGKLGMLGEELDELDEGLGKLGEELDELDEGLGMLGDELEELEEELGMLGILGILEDDEEELDEVWQPTINATDKAISTRKFCELKNVV